MAAALGPITQAGMTVLSVQAGQSILSASALFRLKCSLLNQRQPVTGQRLTGARTRRQLERRLDNTPYARHQYQPFQWPGAVASSSSSSPSSSGIAINENMSGVMAARNASSVHQLRHKPRTRAATAAAASLGDVGESLFPGLSSSLPPLPPVVGSASSMTMTPMPPMMSMLPDAVSSGVDALPPLPALDNGTSSMMSSSSVGNIKYESPSPSFAPFSPSAGFMDMRDFQLPMSPYSTASAFDDGVSVKSEESSRIDEIDEVDEDEDAPAAHLDDAALAVAAVLVRAHEAGYEMDSLTTQIQIALLK